MEEYTTQYLNEFKTLPTNQKIKLNGHEVIILNNTKDYEAEVYFGIIIDNECYDMEYGLEFLGIKRFTLKVNSIQALFSMLKDLNDVSFHEVEYRVNVDDGFQILVNAYKSFSYEDLYDSTIAHPTVLEIYIQKMTEINKEGSNFKSIVYYLDPYSNIMLPYNQLFFDEMMTEKDNNELWELFREIAMVFNVNITFEVENKPDMVMDKLGNLKLIPDDDFAPCGLEKGLCENGCDDKGCQYNLTIEN